MTPRITEHLQESPKNLHRIFRNLQESLKILTNLQICASIFNNFQRVLKQSPQNLHRISTESPQNLGTISTESPQNLHRISTGSPQDPRIAEEEEEEEEEGGENLRWENDSHDLICVSLASCLRPARRVSVNTTRPKNPRNNNKKKEKKPQF